MADSASRTKSPTLPSSYPPNLELTEQTEDPPSRKKPLPTEAGYQSKLRSVKNGALFVAGLQKFSGFCGICALTWASVVLLGGFASSLKSLDFYLISSLLLLEAARLSTSEFFSKLLHKTLFRERSRPEEFEFKDLQNFWSSRLDLIGQLCSAQFAVESFVCAVVRLCMISRGEGLTGRDQSGNQVSNISPALHTFYILVLLNSSSAILSCIIRVYLRQSSEDSLVNFHDEVFKVAMTSGLPDADEDDVFDYAFRKLARDFARNIRPVTIKSRNSEMIKFIYHGENGVGVTFKHLSSTDVWKQVVAAALPGFWAHEGKIEKQVALFWALQDQLYSAGKVAEMAAGSIWTLSKKWAADSMYTLSRKRAGKSRQHPFLISNPNRNSGENIVDSVIDLVLREIHPSLLFQLRALEGCCRSEQVVKHIYNEDSPEHRTELRQRLQNLVSEENEGSEDENMESSRPEKLCRKLLDTLNSSRTRQTTRMYAAGALCALLCFEGKLLEEGACKARLRKMVGEKITLTDHMGDSPKRPYLWMDEKEMLDRLRRSLGLSEFEDWRRIRVVGREGESMDLSPSKKHALASRSGGGNCATP